MNSRITNNDKHSISRKVLSLFILVLTLAPLSSSRAWEVDFSRRKKQMQKQELSTTSLPEKRGGSDIFTKLLPQGLPPQEVVLLNTPRGFVPSVVRLKNGLKYKIYVVNVNENDKNVSFIMENFKAHHSTYFGQIKQFEIEPIEDGIFSFECPETSTQGRLVIYSDPSEPRAPAATQKE